MQLSAACAGVRTLTAEIALSGRAGRQNGADHQIDRHGGVAGFDLGDA